MTAQGVDRGPGRVVDLPPGRVLPVAGRRPFRDHLDKLAGIVNPQLGEVGEIAAVLGGKLCGLRGGRVFRRGEPVGGRLDLRSEPVHLGLGRPKRRPARGDRVEQAFQLPDCLGLTVGYLMRRPSGPRQVLTPALDRVTMTRRASRRCSRYARGGLCRVQSVLRV
jgi:hypothetical protein